MKFLNKIKNKFGVVRKKSSIPYHFEIHDDEFLVEIISEISKSSVFELFFAGLKKLRKKSSVDSVDDLPIFFEADAKQRKALEPTVVNKRFLNDVVEQVKKDVPTFKIINSGLFELTWREVSLDKYEQKIVIKGICYYEE